jgi:hypothetical protein
LLLIAFDENVEQQSADDVTFNPTKRSSKNMCITTFVLTVFVLTTFF